MAVRCAGGIVQHRRQIRQVEHIVYIPSADDRYFFPFPVPFLHPGDLCRLQLGLGSVDDAGRQHRVHHTRPEDDTVRSGVRDGMGHGHQSATRSQLTHLCPVVGTAVIDTFGMVADGHNMSPAEELLFAEIDLFIFRIGLDPFFRHGIGHRITSHEAHKIIMVIIQCRQQEGRIILAGPFPVIMEAAQQYPVLPYPFNILFLLPFFLSASREDQRDEHKQDQNFQQLSHNRLFFIYDPIHSVIARDAVAGSQPYLPLPVFCNGIDPVAGETLLHGKVLPCTILK